MKGFKCNRDVTTVMPQVASAARRSAISNPAGPQPIPNEHRKDREKVAGISPSCSSYQADCEDRTSAARRHNQTSLAENWRGERRVPSSDDPNPQCQSKPAPIASSSAIRHRSWPDTAVSRALTSCCLKGLAPNCRIDSRNDLGRSISACRALKHFEQSSSKPGRSQPQLWHLRTFGPHSEKLEHPCPNIWSLRW